MASERLQSRDYIYCVGMMSGGSQTAPYRPNRADVVLTVEVHFAVEADHDPGEARSRLAARSSTGADAEAQYLKRPSTSRYMITHASRDHGEIQESLDAWFLCLTYQGYRVHQVEPSRAQTLSHTLFHR